MDRDGQSASVRPVIVIVDDDSAVLGSLVFSLQAEGFVVRPYPSGDALLNEAEQGEPGCFVIDYKLPGMNGLDLLTELRRRRVAAPAILITTHPSAALRARTAATGATLIEKPLLDEALFQEIRAALMMT